MKSMKRSTLAVAVFALWAVVVGLVGVSSVVFWLAATACKGFAQSISLLPALFDVLAVHLSKNPARL